MTRKPYIAMLAGCAFLAIGTTGATADCAADLAAFQAEGGISKDGSLAPLQTDPAAGGAAITTGTAGETTAGAEGVAKDGTQPPMQAAEGNVAASGQAAQAQQQADADGGAKAEALTRAETALAAGDEEGCKAALEEARSL